MKKLGVLAIVLVGAFACWLLWPQTSSPQPSPKPKTANSDITLLAAGDFIAHDSINMAAKQPSGSYDYLPLMDTFTPIFRQYDIRFCSDGVLNGGTQFGVSGYPKFNSPTEFVDGMTKVGCNLVANGTNHSFDRDQSVINATADAWARQPNMLAAVGLNKNKQDQQKVHVFMVKNTKVAFLAYTTYLNQDAPAQNDYGVNVFSEDFAKSQIAEAKKQGAQIIIVSMRWGTEFSSQVNELQRKDASFLAAQGVSLILGHGPHVVQPVEKIADTTVWYSLGNFLNTQLQPETVFGGLAQITFNTKTHKITKQSFLPVYAHYEWTADQAAKEDLLARKNVKMYLLKDTTQALIDKQQLKTSVDAQRQRLQTIVGPNVPLSN
ncbi:CapA family protein [Candidatus Saccharibacteria bacterium]|nr:CapA family protein [Candidatus Saccharibacteria bacterium]